MKIFSKLLLPLLVGCTVFFAGFKPLEPPVAPAKGFYPKKVNAIIQDKCYGCHSTEGKNEKPKKALNWDELSNLPAKEQLEKTQQIIAVLEKGTMPPAFLVNRSPEKKLADKEVVKMKKWAVKLTKKLSK